MTTTFVEFLRLAPDGIVHVLDDYEFVEGIPRPFMRPVAVCGRRGRASIVEYPVAAFNDTDLCARCWMATPADRRGHLFQHPQGTV